MAIFVVRHYTTRMDDWRDRPVSDIQQSVLGYPSTWTQQSNCCYDSTELASVSSALVPAQGSRPTVTL